MVSKQYNKLVFSGGALKSIAFIGCIRFLEHLGMLSDVCTLVGSSAGAIVAFMLCLGLSSQEMEEWILEKFRIGQANQLDIDGVLELYDNMGIDRGTGLEVFFVEILQSKLGSDKNDVTFMDLAKVTGRHLIICASNLTTSKPEYFSVDTWPDLSVITALKASCCIPVLFTPIIVNDMMFVDGGMFENLPVGSLANLTHPESHRQNIADHAGVLVMNVSWWPTPTMPTNMVSFAWYLMSAMLHRANHVVDVKDIGQRLGWTVVDIPPELFCENKTNERGCDGDSMPRSPSEYQDVPFSSVLGFSMESMAFEIDTDRLTRCIDSGYKALQQCGCLDEHDILKTSTLHRLPHLPNQSI